MLKKQFKNIYLYLYLDFYKYEINFYHSRSPSY